jgi:glutamyl-tRNA synthetase
VSLTSVSHQIVRPISRPIGENVEVEKSITPDFSVTRGRFAPSPTGVLHVGNLRTALVAWLAATSAGGEMLVRVEDLDRANSSLENENRQLADLQRIGIDFPRPVWRQSERFPVYDAVIDDLSSRGLTYPCFCSRKEIREAASAQHGPLPEGAYPGTCRDLTADQAEERIASGRPFAVRLRTDGETYTFHDRIVGDVAGSVDDVVLRRNDGVPAYNLAVVVDDAAQGVTEVVRGDDLLLSTPRHLHLQTLLGFSHPEYAHVPLVFGGDGERLAKRHGAVTLDDLVDLGETVRSVVAVLLDSLGLPSDPVAAVDAFAWSRLLRTPWTIPDRWQTRTS